MKNNKFSYFLIELILLIFVCICLHRILFVKPDVKNIAVIVENSGNEKWDSCINGMKQYAKNNNIHLIICNTSTLENSDLMKNFIDEQVNRGIDALIIDPAPGINTKEIIDNVDSRIPIILINSDLYKEESKNDRNYSSDYPSITADNYIIGCDLANMIITDNNADIKGKTIGIIYKYNEKDNTSKIILGVNDTISNSGATVDWILNLSENDDAEMFISMQSKVDYILTLDNEITEKVAINSTEGIYNSAKLYGVGSSLKCISLLDQDKLCGLVINDGYFMGYSCIEEIDKKIKKSSYKCKSQFINHYVIHKEDIYTEKFEDFLYTFE